MGVRAGRDAEKRHPCAVARAARQGGGGKLVVSRQVPEDRDSGPHKANSLCRTEIKNLVASKDTFSIMALKKFRVKLEVRTNGSENFAG